MPEARDYIVDWVLYFEADNEAESDRIYEAIETLLCPNPGHGKEEPCGRLWTMGGRSGPREAFVEDVLPQYCETCIYYVNQAKWTLAYVNANHECSVPDQCQCDQAQNHVKVIRPEFHPLTGKRFGAADG